VAKAAAVACWVTQTGRTDAGPEPDPRTLRLIVLDGAAAEAGSSGLAPAGRAVSAAPGGTAGFTART